MKRSATGEPHWFGEHPDKLNRGTAFGAWVPRFLDLARDLAQQGVECVNCSPDSALQGF